MSLLGRREVPINKKTNSFPNNTWVISYTIFTLEKLHVFIIWEENKPKFQHKESLNLGDG
jgi:hypothetical protein